MSDDCWLLESLSRCCLCAAQAAAAERDSIFGFAHKFIMPGEPLRVGSYYERTLHGVLDGQDELAVSSRLLGPWSRRMPQRCASAENSLKLAGLHSRLLARSRATRPSKPKLAPPHAVQAHPISARAASGHGGPRNLTNCPTVVDGCSWIALSV